MERDKVVYLHRKETDSSVFYVGVGSVKRPYCKDGRSRLWNRFVKKYGCVIEIYKDGLTKEEAFEMEINLIDKYGRIDLKSGQLVNHTRGGIAIEGLSEKTLSKRSKSFSSVKRTDEWRKKISISHKGKVKSKEHRENISKSMTGKKLPESTKEKMGLSNKSKVITARPVACYDYLTSDFISDFCSLREAAKYLGCLETSISNNLSGRSIYVKSKTLNKKLKFKYKWD
jgi:hypothetical protein